MPTDTHKTVISADNTPPGQHMRRYNAPTIDEVAIVIFGDQFLPRNIILHKRNAQLVRITKTHRVIIIGLELISNREKIYKLVIVFSNFFSKE